ncbi:MAG: AAA family ATPase, partial [Flavobacterium sp.]
MNHLQARDKVLHFINQTRQSVFLTGKAGTGKTTLLNEITATTHKNVVVVAPTGIAALNAKGVTIHSMFQLPFYSFIPTNQLPEDVSPFLKVETQKTLVKHYKMNRNKRSVLTQMELLIIDEVSMLRADLLDAIDYTLRVIRKNKKPFGGVQVLMVGDLMQLPPVVKNEEWQILKTFYSSIYFFSAKVIQDHPPVYIELEHIYRQQDKLFIDLLNNLRNNKITQEDQNTLKQYVNTNFDSKQHPGYITLTTHNASADDLNASALSDLNGKSFSYKASIKGEFPEKMYPVEDVLMLKKNAQVMFIK